jgi:hypothetical protein
MVFEEVDTLPQALVQVNDGKKTLSTIVRLDEGEGRSAIDLKVINHANVYCCNWKKDFGQNREAYCNDCKVLYGLSIESEAIGVYAQKIPEFTPEKV